MRVTKRNGSIESVSFDKITRRLQPLCCLTPELPKEVDPVLITQKVAQGVFDCVKTEDLDHLASEIAAGLASTHPGYGTLAARIEISNLHKKTPSSLLEVSHKLYNNINSKTKMESPLISLDLYNLIYKHHATLESAITYERDYLYDYFGFKTLEKSYLFKSNGKLIERPQHMIMRVSLGIHGEDIPAALETYYLMSTLKFTHATPTLFNSGTPIPQLSSCFLLTMKDDSIEGIYETLKQCALISKSAGGIGISIHNIRAANSYIRGTNGTSNGIVPMLRVFNDTARYVDQGGGKRKGAFAIYLEPWHSDIYDFLQLKKNHGKEEQRARDLFFALWISDLFMKRVMNNEEWSLFCPNEAPGLGDVWGTEFEELYCKYEQQQKARRKVQAQDLWFAILESQIESGTPYMLYKDSCNRKSNQQNLGTIKSSNLCTEIVEYTSADEVAVCNLASLALPRYVKDGHFDHDELFRVTKVVAKNLDKIIDINYYPIPEARKSNMRHRPIGIGVQGLADVFSLLRLPWESEEAKKVNRDIFETIYFAALTSSNEQAKLGGHYETYMGSPASKGLLQFDLWDVKPSDRWDWNGLKESIKTYGLRNSLVCAPMPTASTSQILGNNECFEPYTSNLYTRRILAGDFTVINQHLLKDLLALGIWTADLKNKLIAHNGSVQQIDEIPPDVKRLYKTVWEITQRTLIDMAADRGAFIDQSQSLNIHIAEPTFAKLTSMHFYAWQRGLKTGMYYLRTRPAASAIKFTVDTSTLTTRPSASTAAVKSSSSPPQGKSDEVEDDMQMCTMQEGCLMCGS